MKTLHKSAGFRRANGSLSAGFGLGVLALATSAFGQSTYYVSPTGSDAADGLTPQTAWASLGKVDYTSFAPGSNILFERGSEWRGQLSASSSGTAANPITYGAYGVGAKPTFYGSDVLSKAAFTPVASGSTAYSVTSSKEVFSVLASGDFLHSANLISGTAAASVNIPYVTSTPNTWYYDNANAKLYVNTGNTVAAESRQLTGVVQDDIVYSNGKDNLVFRDLIVDESARYDAGYGFRVQSSANVQILNSEAYHGGKHNFGVINSTGFVGDGLVAKYAMPNQGTGGATALVSYADGSVTGATSTWKNITVSDYNESGQAYPAFLTHGEGLGQINLQNVVSSGAPVVLAGDTIAKGLTVTNADISLYGGVTLDGLHLSGVEANVRMYGGGATIRNMLLESYTFAGHSYPSAIVVSGPSNTIELSTITLNTPYNPSLIAYTTADSSLTFLGNIVKAYGNNPLTYLYSYQPGASNFVSDYNLWDAAGFPLASVQSLLGSDVNSLGGTAIFVNPLTGDYRLAAGSLGLDAIPAGYFAMVIPTDILGQLRASGAGIDIGAFELAIPEPGFAVFSPLLALGLLRRRR